MLPSEEVGPCSILHSERTHFQYCSESAPRPRDQHKAVPGKSTLPPHNSQGYRCTSQTHDGLHPAQIGRLQCLGHQRGHSGFGFAWRPENTVGPEFVPYLE